MSRWSERRAMRRAGDPVPTRIRLAHVSPGTDLDGDGDDDLAIDWSEAEMVPEPDLSPDGGADSETDDGTDSDGLSPGGRASFGPDSITTLPPRAVRKPRRRPGDDRVSPIVPDGWWDRVIDEAKVWVLLAGYHGLRVVTGLYFVRCARHAPAGLWRLSASVLAIVTDWEGAPARQVTSAQGRAAEYLALSAQRDRRVRQRAPVFVLLAIALALVVAGGVAAALNAPTFGGRLVGLSVLVGLTVGLGFVGQPEDAPIVPAARAAVLKIPPMDNERIREAFYDAELPKRPSPALLARIANGQASAATVRQLTFVTDPARVGPGRGTGYEFTLDLPPGKPAEEALKRHGRIASGLGVAKAQLHIAPVAESARRINVYVADSDPWGGQAPVTPLAEATQVNFWEAQPFGVDMRGFPVRVRMVWTAMLVAAIPRMGKSTAAVNIALGAALDWRVRLIAFNGKPGIWSEFAPVCHRFVEGVRDDAVEYVHRCLLEIKADMDRRTELISQLGPDVAPQSKLTPDIAADPRYDCPLTLVVIDEAQRYLQHATWGTKIAGLLEEIAEVAPSAGYMLLLAIQRPTSHTITTRLRGALGLRFVLRMMDDDGTRAALGKVLPGLNPKDLKKAHKGVGVLDGSENEEASLEDQPEAQFVRTYLVDLPLVRSIVTRGKALRASKGRLTGYAAGDDLRAEDTPVLLLDHLLEVVAMGEDEVWSETLIERIAQAHPNLYDGWAPRDLAQHLKHFGVPTHQIKRTVETVGEDGERTTRQVNRRGVRTTELAAGYDHEMARRSAPDGASAGARNGGGGAATR